MESKGAGVTSDRMVSPSIDSTMPSQYSNLDPQGLHPSSPSEDYGDALQLNSSGSMNKDDWKSEDSDRASPSGSGSTQPTAPATPTPTASHPRETLVSVTDADGNEVPDELLEEKTALEDEPLTMTTYMVVPPDGGWGWVIVAASFMCNLVVDGIIFTFGMLQPLLVEEFGVAQSEVALVGSLQTGFYLMAGPFVSALANRYGFRLVTILGAVLGGAGFALSSMATSVQFLFLSYGLLGGIGFGMIYVPSVITTGFYFERWRALATGIAVCGSGIGTTLMGPICEAIIAHLGWKGLLLVQGGMVLSLSLMGALFRPLQPTKVEVPYDPIKAAELEAAEAAAAKDEGAGEQRLPLLQRIKRARDELRAHSTASLHDHGANNNYPTAAQVLGASTRVLKASCLSLDVSVTPNKGHAHQQHHGNHLNGDLSKSEKRLSAPIRDGVTPPSSPRVAKALTPEQRRGSAVVPRRQRAQSESHSGRRTHHGANGTPRATGARPMYRDDIFFGASLQRLPEYGSKVSALDYTMSVTRLPTKADLAEESSQTCSLCPEAVRRTLYTMLDLSLLRSPTFLLLAMSGFFTMMGFYVPFCYLKARAVEGKWEESSALWLVPSIGISNTVARVACGVLSSMPGVNALLINNVSLTLGGVGTMLSGLSLTAAYQFSYTTVFGLAIACFASLRSILIVELLGLDKLTNAFGLLLLFQGVAACMGTPIAGAFKDATGGFDYTFYLAGILITLSAVMCYPLNMVNAWEKKRNAQADKDTQVVAKVV
ncbi:monocarboxylate transporter 10 isoform X2 [Frankliniella occidentalis]|uniref:Monocarboxylate transporter 10 isoform X2 n=1 Tax=Frankliniella occidentalis TaxID=133901 RepID=A0A6J1S898_FRAOC|nr:monocarboxylate transporter 10 isoform X2 [Frankliniella occidentalis]